MSQNNKKIIIATGGTGGHIFPSLSLADFLKEEYDIEITTDRRGLKYLKNLDNINIKIINSNTIFNKNILKIFTAVVNIIFSTIYSFAMIIKLKPKIVIGMGGYSSFPVCLAACFLRVPVLIYENNLILGRANKFLLPFVKKILVSTNSISGIDSKYKHKVFFSGYLLRSQIFNLEKNDFELDKKELSILIIGGSQSAKIFSEVLPIVIKNCCKNNIKFKIYQQCSDVDRNEIKKTYTKLNIDFKLFSFSDDLFEYYQKTDLAITRSGASSIAELINLRIPFVAIPLPSSTDNHQFENAFYFKNKGYCFLLEEKFIHDKLFEILKDLNKDRTKLLSLKKKMSEHSDKDAISKIHKLIKTTLNV